MMYFYRLQNNKDNFGKDLRSLEGIVLHKHRWHVSKDKINWGSYASLVESREASSTEDFNNQKLLEIQSHRAKIRRPIIPKKPSPILEEKIINITKEETKEEIIDLKEEPILPQIVEEKDPIVFSKTKIRKMKKKDLIEALLLLKVPEDEFQDLKIKTLRDLLILTQEIHDV